MAERANQPVGSVNTEGICKPETRKSQLQITKGVKISRGKLRFYCVKMVRLSSPKSNKT
jgi:hypothetical protein